jgi:hypothetical protein
LIVVDPKTATTADGPRIAAAVTINKTK